MQPLMQPLATQPVSPSPTLLRAVDEPLGDLVVAAVYRAATAGGISRDAATAARLSLSPAQLDDAIASLRADHLLRAGDDDRLVAVDPAVAAAALVSPLQREIAQQQQRIDEARERADRFRADFVACGRRPAATSDRAVGVAEIRGLLDLAVARCTGDVLVVLSGRQDAVGLAELVEPCRALVARGAAVRIVAAHRARADLTSRTLLRRLVDAGAQIRTLSQLPRSAMLFGADDALLFDDGDRPAETVSASTTADRDLVAFLYDQLGELWERGTALDARDVGYGDVADDLRRAIVELMSQGHTDEVVARKLGMSTRTCRRHISALLTELGAVSRFQAGLQAGRSNVLGTG